MQPLYPGGATPLVWLPRWLRGQVTSVSLTTKQRSQISSSFSTSVRMSGSRVSPNHTTWGRRSPLQPSSSHLFEKGTRLHMVVFILIWAHLTCLWSSTFFFHSPPHTLPLLCAGQRAADAVPQVCWKYTRAAWPHATRCWTAVQLKYLGVTAPYSVPEMHETWNIVCAMDLSCHWN